MSEVVYNSASEAGKAIGVSHATIANWFRSGRLKGERVKRAGKSVLRIRHVDLVEASRGTMFEQPVAEPQLSFDQRRHPLTLDVFWPIERRAQPFSDDLLSGFDTFKALTYTVSLPYIFELLTTQDFDLVEVLFGSEELVRETDAAKVTFWQASIETELARGYIGIGGSTDPRTKQLMDWQAEGRAKFYVASGGIDHSKLYFMERPGLRRVLVGSANLSRRAMSGRQGEVLLAFDNDPWMWEELDRKYEAARSIATGMRLKGETRPAHLIRAEDLPAGREAKNGKESVTIYTFEPTDMPGDPEHIAVTASELDENMGEALRENIKSLPKGEAVIQRASLKRINYAASPKKSENTEKMHSLARANDRFIYDGRPIERPVSSKGIEGDALHITQYMDNFSQFGENSGILQRNYFGLMGWLYFAPFMPELARQKSRLGETASKSVKHMAIIYGQSNCGKSALVNFLLTSMFGPPATLDDSQFTQSAFKRRAEHTGVLPIYYQDVSSPRFIGKNRNQGELIAKYYDQLVSTTARYPCTIVTANADVTEFANEVRNRAFLVYTPTGVASDDEETRLRLDKEVLPLLNRVGQDFYAEYLHRMADIMASTEDFADFDYLWESTLLIRTLLIENLLAGEALPAWAISTTATDFNGYAWELKHTQMANRLTHEKYSSTFPPPVGFWSMTDTEIMVGVDNVREAMQSKAFQDHWIKRESNDAVGRVVTLHRQKVEDSIQRTYPDWTLPLPLVNRFVNLFLRK